MLRLIGLFLIALTICGASDPASAQRKQQRNNALSANQYVTMHPFILPLVAAADPNKQYTVVLALELADGDARDEVIRLEPRIRDALYPELYRLIAFRDRDPRNISTSSLKRKLTPLVQRIVGEELVKGLVVQEAYESDLP